MGLMSMGRKYGNDRLESACNRAIITNCVSYKSIKSILMPRWRWLKIFSFVGSFNFCFSFYGGDFTEKYLRPLP